METIFARCAGLDIHKESVEAQVRVPGSRRSAAKRDAPLGYDDTGLAGHGRLAGKAG